MSSIRRVKVVRRSSTMNFVRIVFALLTIVLLLVSTASSLDPHGVPLAILPVVFLFFGFLVSHSSEPDESGFAELTAAHRLLATRAPPLS
jgi:threonine/homoserine efflux transporter RhtA